MGEVIDWSILTLMSCATSTAPTLASVAVFSRPTATAVEVLNGYSLSLSLSLSLCVCVSVGVRHTEFRETTTSRLRDLSSGRGGRVNAT